MNNLCMGESEKILKKISVCNETKFIIERLRQDHPNGYGPSGTRPYDTIKKILQDKLKTDFRHSILDRVLKELNRRGLLWIKDHRWGFDIKSEIFCSWGNRPLEATKK